MTNEGPRYTHSARIAATIMNLQLHSDDTPVIKFGKILFLILEGMDEAERELAEMRSIVSRN
jgi:hypothetical protein